MTGTYCKNEYKLIRKQCMMALWKLMVFLPTERLFAQEPILSAYLPALSFHCPCPLQLFFFLLRLLLCIFLFSLSLSVSPAVPYHSPVELPTELTVNLSFMASVMKHWCNGCGKPLVRHPKVLNLFCNGGIALHHTLMHALQLRAILMINVKEHKRILHNSGFWGHAKSYSLLFPLFNAAKTF